MHARTRFHEHARARRGTHLQPSAVAQRHHHAAGRRVRRQDAPPAGPKHPRMPGARARCLVHTLRALRAAAAAARARAAAKAIPIPATAVRGHQRVRARPPLLRLLARVGPAPRSLTRFAAPLRPRPALRQPQALGALAHRRPGAASPSSGGGGCSGGGSCNGRRGPQRRGCTQRTLQAAQDDGGGRDLRATWARAPLPVRPAPQPTRTCRRVVLAGTYTAQAWRARQRERARTCAITPSCTAPTATVGSHTATPTQSLTSLQVPAGDVEGGEGA